MVTTLLLASNSCEMVDNVVPLMNVRFAAKQLAEINGVVTLRFDKDTCVVNHDHSDK